MSSFEAPVCFDPPPSPMAQALAPLEPFAWPAVTALGLVLAYLLIVHHGRVFARLRAALMAFRAA